MNIKKLTAIVLTGALLLLTACSDSDSGSGKKSKKKDYYTIGETWTVDGQWSLTVTGVTETAERNEYATKNLQRSTSWTTNIQTSVTRTRTA